MTEHKNIYMALCAAQANMGRVVKGAVNPAFKSKYADLADVVAVVVPALTAEGIAMFHVYGRDEHGAHFSTVLSHGASDTSIRCDVPLIVDRNNMQGMKSAVTYAKRIGLESLTGIAPEDDDGNAAAKAAPQRETAQRQAPAPDDRAIQHAKEYIAYAETVDGVTERWKALPDNVRNAPAVIDAAKARKAELQAQPSIADTLQDEIPHEGK